MPCQQFIVVATSATVLTLLSACAGERAGSPESVAAPSSPNGAAKQQTGALDDGAASSCVEGYSALAVAERAFSFDGTVTEIATSGPSDDFAYVSVTFAVNEWFRGGTTDRVTVDMATPDATTEEVAISGGSYGLGSRLLVSGEPRWGGPPLEDAIAWGCGFTRYYDPRTTSSWRQAAETWHANASERGGKREVKVYFIDPVVRDFEWVQWSLQSEEVSTNDTGDPAIDAVRALFNSHPKNDNLVNGWSALTNRPAPLAHVQHVAVADGVITVDISQSVWDPYPTLACLCPTGDEVMQQLVWTVQSALGSNDPVALTVNGKPARGIWQTRLDGPVAGDRTVVAQTLEPPASSGITISPNTVRPGETIALTFPPDNEHRLGFSISQRANGGWQHRYYFLAAVSRENDPYWRLDDEPGWDLDLEELSGISEWGSGPEYLWVPVTATAGQYQVCTLGPNMVCGVFNVTAQAGEADEALSWNCPAYRIHIIVPAMTGAPTMMAAAHWTPGKEQVRVLWHRGGHASALVRHGGGGTDRIALQRKSDGRWYATQAEVCGPQKLSVSKSPARHGSR